MLFIIDEIADMVCYEWDALSPAFDLWADYEGDEFIVWCGH